MALAILANFSRIRQSEISLVDLKILTNFAIFATACISGHMSHNYLRGNRKNNNQNAVREERKEVTKMGTT